MIILLKPQASLNDANMIIHILTKFNLKTVLVPNTQNFTIVIIGNKENFKRLDLNSIKSIANIKYIPTKYKLVSRKFQSKNSIIKVGNLKIGGNKFALIAGPCAIESKEQFLNVAQMLAKNEANGLRGGAFKPRTSPYSFQGLGAVGLELLKQANLLTNLPTFTELMDLNQLENVCNNTDCIQIGSRNMQNYPLLKEIGQTKKPILLKRGLAATIDEWLLAAEYIYSNGNPNIILCERGIRTFETATRNTLDLNAVAYIKERSHLPIIIDPSHGCGIRSLITPLSKAAVAIGADGIIIETHLNPEQALSDGAQSLNQKMYCQLVEAIKPILTVLGKTL